MPKDFRVCLAIALGGENCQFLLRKPVLHLSWEGTFLRSGSITTERGLKEIAEERNEELEKQAFFLIRLAQMQWS